ncbi:MAG: methyl-accepting chemotaxis protein [Gammaproteobacteria bacterium]|jgi:methyl-accepting chemotaxis protein
MDEIANMSEKAAIGSGESKASVQTVTANLGDLLGKISSINDRSNQFAQQTHAVADTLNMINSITDQTILLALNAAIEAARAGVHGRGFAVVTDEVKKLAATTRKATDEIQAMMKGFIESAHQMQSGANDMIQMANRSQEVIDQFPKSIKTIGDSSLAVFQRNSFAQIVSFCSLIKLEHHNDLIDLLIAEKMQFEISSDDPGAIETEVDFFLTNTSLHT